MPEIRQFIICRYVFQSCNPCCHYVYMYADLGKRRRAQNRASQRAFRDRKEKYVKEVEERLKELENKYNNLSEAHENLRREYVTLKRELDTMSVEDARSPDGISPSGSFRNENAGEMIHEEGSFGLHDGNDMDLHHFDTSLLSFDFGDIDGNAQRRRI
jgi:hypothetical protein